MRKTVTVCDRCGKENTESFSAVAGRYYDVSGNVGNRIYSVDICLECACLALEAYAKKDEANLLKRIMRED